MLASDSIECPLCFSRYRKEEIDVHVNSCLHLDKDDAEDDEKKNIIIINDNMDKANEGLGNANGSIHDVTSIGSKSKTTHNTNRSLSEVLGKRKPIANSIRILKTRNDRHSNALHTHSQTLSKGSQGQQRQQTDIEEDDKYLERQPKKMKLDCSYTSECDSNMSGNILIKNNESDPNPMKVKASFDDKILTNTSNATFGERNKKIVLSGIPLAEQMRPISIQEYIGQIEAIGKHKIFRSLIMKNEVPSMIFWGPPGCGKTSLANIIGNNCKKSKTVRFAKLSATTSGINDVKEAVKVAKNELNMFKRKTILFIDEIHRFNKLQQDAFLAHVETGTITLIGATTENPSFHVNNALLSRCQVIVLDKLSNDDIMKILDKAASNLETVNLQVAQDALVTLANLCDGDARMALNGLEMAVNSQVVATSDNGAVPDFPDDVNKVTITSDHVNEVFQRKRIAYDRNGEEHYNMISALHKSIRGSDDNATLYWLARMLEGGEQPLFVARRLVRIASEDIGLADPSALQQAVAAYQACHFIGMPECDVILAQAAVYLARAPKSIEVYSAYNKAKDVIKNWRGPLPGVPLHLRNASSKLMKDIGYGKGYKYNPNYKEAVEQDYLPKELCDARFLTPH